MVKSALKEIVTEKKNSHQSKQIHSSMSRIADQEKLKDTV